ncbi:MAG: hypothetical protein MJ078_07125 [Clostridia bacterium]|nr:hypothetical protein [Clostridia bacterium]
MWWKKAGIALLGAVFIAAAFFSGKSVGAASKTPGGAEDPLITLSYLESRLDGTGGFCKVSLKKGQTLLGTEGTQIILLGGSAASRNSVADLTEGKLLSDDLSMFLYHSYLVPEDDSGCTALSACVLFVSGSYEVVEKSAK